jgi:hypothetical protein
MDNNVANENSRTSENILGILKQPELTCPDIDRIIKAIEEAYYIADIKEDECRDSGNDCGHEDSFGDIRFTLAGLIKDLERLRVANYDLRSWGQDWKDVAKKLLDRYEPDWRNE